MSEPAATHPPLVVWVVSDGKPGHANQSLGLAEALARATPTEIFTLPALPAWRAWLALLLKRAPGTSLPAPDLIVGAGHATHLTLLATRRARGGRAVVLMKPSLPRRWFDLCVTPQHDGIAADAHTLVTEGALNRIRPAATRDARHGLSRIVHWNARACIPNTVGAAPRRDCRIATAPPSARRRASYSGILGRMDNPGLLLIGGASKHFEWDSDAVLVQIKSILARTPDTQWTLTTSRRTPADFLDAMPPHPNLTIVPHTATPPDWLPEQLARSSTVWVTPDSASMVFEALTAGAAVGVFDLPLNPTSRVGRAIAHLADAQRITRFADWCAHGTLHPNLHPLAEANRCAQIVMQRWFDAHQVEAIPGR